MQAGINIINPLQEFLTEDEEMMEHAMRYGVKSMIFGNLNQKKTWKLFTGKILEVSTPIITVLRDRWCLWKTNNCNDRLKRD